MNLRARIVLVALAPLLTCGGLVAVAATRAEQPAEVPAPVERVHRYYAAGPSAEYSGDSGGLATVAPMRWTVPAGGPTTDGVVEVSFRYRTKGDGPFVIDLGVREDGGPRAVVRPDELALAPVPGGTSTTVRFLVPDLASGHTYEAFLGVNSVPPDRGVNRIRTSKVLVTVDMETTPSAG